MPAATAQSETRRRAVLRRVLGPFGFSVVRDNGREATIVDDDRLIVSYPRSGNTWLSFLVTTLTHPGEPTTFANLEERCADIYAHTDAYLRALPRPRLLKSHEPFDPRYPRVVYLVRDPRDVAVSYFRFLVKTRRIDESLPKDEFVAEFVRGAWEPAYGSWADHVGSWRGARDGHDSFLLLRYEDLHADPVASLHAVAGFLQIEATPAQCEEAVALCSSDRMRDLERQQAQDAPGLKGTRLGVPFVGAATVGKGAAEMTEEQQHAITSAWEPLMSDLGYLDAAALSAPVRSTGR